MEFCWGTGAGRQALIEATAQHLSAETPRQRQDTAQARRGSTFCLHAVSRELRSKKAGPAGTVSEQQHDADWPAASHDHLRAMQAHHDSKQATGWHAVSTASARVLFHRTLTRSGHQLLSRGEGGAGAGMLKAAYWDVLPVCDGRLIHPKHARAAPCAPTRRPSVWVRAACHIRAQGQSRTQVPALLMLCR